MAVRMGQHAAWPGRFCLSTHRPLDRHRESPSVARFVTQGLALGAIRCGLRGKEVGAQVGACERTLGHTCMCAFTSLIPRLQLAALKRAPLRCARSLVVLCGWVAMAPASRARSGRARRFASRRAARHAYVVGRPTSASSLEQDCATTGRAHASVHAPLALCLPRSP